MTQRHLRYVLLPALFLLSGCAEVTLGSPSCAWDAMKSAWHDPNQQIDPNLTGRYNGCMVNSGQETEHSDYRDNMVIPNNAVVAPAPPPRPVQ